MNSSKNAHCGSHTSKENSAPSSKTDALQAQRTKQRTVLGVLSENEQRCRPLSQVSRRGRNFVIFNSLSPLRAFKFQLNLAIHREANFPNTVWSQTAPSSPSSAVPQVPAMTCMLKRLVKLFLPPLAKKWSRTAITQMPKLLPCEMKICVSCWSWVQVSLAKTKTPGMFSRLFCYTLPDCCLLL